MTKLLFCYIICIVHPCPKFSTEKNILIRHSSATNQQFNLGSNDSSATDGTTSTISSKNIVSERSRRKKLSDKLLALREAVPKISKVTRRCNIY
jgi:hypothetical protein